MKDKIAETEEQRTARLEMSAMLQTQVIPDKKKYKRKRKHKKEWKDESY
jgi:hypothetical protein